MCTTCVQNTVHNVKSLTTIIYVVQVKTRRGREVCKPLVVHTYNHCMDGVDVADQLAVFYSFIRKTRKWWRKVFFWMLESACVNSYLLYRQHTRVPRSYLNYRRALVEDLATACVQIAPPHQLPGRPRKRQADDPERLDHNQHFLSKRQPGQHRDCLVCSTRGGERHRTMYYCKTCIDHPSLCPDKCFERYHTHSIYRS